MLDGTQRIHCVSVKPSLAAFSVTDRNDSRIWP
jgi:hypothetical protein